MANRLEVTAGPLNIGFYDPATGLARSKVPLSLRPVSVVPTIPVGSLYVTLAELTGLGTAEMIEIQNLGPSNLKIGTATDPVVGDITFENYALGDVVGQDGWLFGASGGTPPTFNVTASMIMGGLKALGMSPYSFAAGDAVSIARPFTVPTTGGWSMSWEWYKGADTADIGGFTSLYSMVVKEGAVIGIGSSFGSVQWTANGQLQFTGASGGFFVMPTVPALTKHTLTLNYDPTSATTTWALNGAVVLTDPAPGPYALLPAISIENYLSAFGGVDLPADYWLVDNIRVTPSTLKLVGMTINAGSGEKYQAGGRPFPLDSLALAVAAGGANTTIELLVIGT